LEADPVCAVLYWQKVCRAFSPLLSGRSWTRALIVPAGLSKPYGRLAEVDLAAAVQRVRKGLGSSSLRDRIVIGAIDISLHLKNSTMVGWQLHLNLLIEGKNSRQLQKVIEAVFPAEQSVKKPYLFADVTDPGKALGRLYSTKFCRRSWYKVSKKIETARMPLTGGDVKELLAFLGRYQVGARLLLSGLRWDGNVLVHANVAEENGVTNGLRP